MWRKIHSNRDPGDTLWKELRKEFGHYINALGSWFKRLCMRHPKSLWCLMACLLLLSAAISLTRKPTPYRHPEVSTATRPVRDGLDQVLSTTQKIRETLTLQHFADSLARKTNLSPADSLALENALNRLEQLGGKIKNHEAYEN